MELDKSQLQLPKLKEQKQKFCLSEVELAVRIPHFPLTGTETTVTLFAIHFIYLELDRDGDRERGRRYQNTRNALNANWHRI